MLSLIIAPSGYGKTDAVIERIGELVKYSDKKIFVIVPEQESVKFEALLLGKLGNGINRSVEVLNFSRLANRVFREAGGITYKYVDDCGKDLMTAVLLEKMNNSIPSFSSGAEDINYIRNLRAEMDVMRRKGITPRDFERVKDILSQGDRGGKNLENKLSDFSVVFSSYISVLKDGNTDATDDIERLAEALSDYDFFENSYVFIDGFYDYTVPQYKVIERIIKSALETTVTFSLSLTDPEKIFRKTRKAYDEIRQIAEKNSVEYKKTELTENKRAKNPALSFLADNFMYGRDGKYEGEVTGVSVTETKNRYEECIFVAREITKLIKNGASFSDIAVVSSSIADYGTMLENVFDSYGIRYLSCIEASPVTEPIFALVQSALDTVNSRFFYKNLKTYLKSPYLGLDEKELYSLENYISLWNVRFKAWENDEDWTMHPRGYVETFTEADKIELEEVNRARRKVYAPLKKLLDGTADKLVENKVRAIFSFLEELEVIEKIDGSDSDEISAWNMLVLAFDHIVRMAGDLKVSKERFAKYLRLALTDMTFGRIPSTLDEVEIGDIDFVRNKSAKHMFFLGFNEGSFPRAGETKSIFTESERRWLAENDISLEDKNEDKMCDENFLFLISLLTPSESINFVFHTASDESSKSASLPSYFYSNVKDCLGVEIKRFDSEHAIPVTRKELEGRMISSGDGEAIHLIEERCRKSAKNIKDVRRFLEAKDKLFHIDNASDFIRSSYRMTQSRLDKFERCRFSYFVEYMLKARTRKQVRFSNAEIGSYVHKILELVLIELTSDGKEINTVTEEEIVSLTELRAREFIEAVAPDVDRASPKFKYLVDNISAFVVFVVENIREEFAVSKFKPTLFEENLGASKEVKPYEVKLNDGGTLTFYGIIDRVDTYIDENGTEYVRVVDYKTKTGGKSFSLEDVINGMNIQMLIYLFAMTKTETEHKRAAAGIMYMPAGKIDFKPTEIERTDEELRLEVDNNLKRSGMYLDDRAIIDAMESGEDKRFVGLKYDKKTGDYVSTASSTLIQLEAFGLIERYINVLFNEVVGTLKKGDVAPQPLEEGSGRTSCDWCSFKPICRYEGEARKPRREKKPLEYIKSVLGEE